MLFFFPLKFQYQKVSKYYVVIILVLCQLHVILQIVILILCVMNVELNEKNFVLTIM